MRVGAEGEVLVIEALAGGDAAVGQRQSKADTD
jgi:hypothetical protein